MPEFEEIRLSSVPRSEANSIIEIAIYLPVHIGAKKVALGEKP
jgi:hypothetical protein